MLCVCVCLCVFIFANIKSLGLGGGAFFQQQVRACPHNAYCGSSGCSLSVLASLYIRIGPHYDLCVYLYVPSFLTSCEDPYSKNVVSVYVRCVSIGICATHEWS